LINSNIHKKPKQPKFVPMFKREAEDLGWNEIDVLLITGDAFVDHPSFGIAIIARILIDSGYRIGVIAQPDWKKSESLLEFGKPKIACAITSGNLDSMLNIYTAARRLRKEDAYSSGGKAGLRPQYSTNVYSNLARSAFPGVPVIIGGIEASMRRIAHFDYWKDKISPTLLQSSKANILLYGMCEKSIVEVVNKIKNNQNLQIISGSAIFLGGNDSKEFLEKTPKDEFIELPSFDEVCSQKGRLMVSHKLSEQEMNPYCGKKIIQKYGGRILLVNKPAMPLKTDEVDEIYNLPFSKVPHPKYKEKIPAFEMIKNSITTIRGCPGGCSFCGLGLHQGRFLQSRSKNSIINEIKNLTNHKYFKGTISDVGGPTANAYQNFPKEIEKCKKCRRSSCLFPEICSNFIIKEKELVSLLREILKIEKVKHVFITSGIRLDMAAKQPNLMREIVRKHVSGHLKVAPEHLDDKVLKLMRKNSADCFYKFIDFFTKESQKIGKKQFIVPYFISNFPGADNESIKKIDSFLAQSKWSLQQVQDFIPLPMTIASAMYYEGLDFKLNSIKVNRGLKERRPQLKKLKKKR
jgi:uncharacterized radical SAM protein YgiQ